MEAKRKRQKEDVKSIENKRHGIYTTKSTALVTRLFILVEKGTSANFDNDVQRNLTLQSFPAPQSMKTYTLAWNISQRC